MPLYNYRCDSCENEFDQILSMNDRKTPETLPCPKCEATGTVLQQLSAPAICAAHRMDCTSSSKPQGDFKERMAQIKNHFKKDKHANIPDF